MARDFVQHYSAAWETGKAMLVFIDKVTCVRMHQLIEKYWDKQIEGLESALHRAGDTSQDEIGARRKQIGWMRETRAAVVASEEQGEVQKSRRWGLDITPHRKLIKEGMDLPETMHNKPQYRNMQRMELDAAFKTCINVQGVNALCAARDTIDIVYKSLRQDREKADISDIIRQLHAVVDGAIEVQTERVVEPKEPYDTSKVDFEKLKQEFERSQAKQTTVQNLKTAVEQRLKRMLAQNPLRTDFQRHYEETIAEYNREKDQVTIEKTFESLLKLVQDLDEEENQAIREGLDEESLALFDLLKKSDLSAGEIKRIKAIAVKLLEMLKAEKLRADHWTDKEATCGAVLLAIREFLWSESTGLPVEQYTEDDVRSRTDDVYRHVFRIYPRLPSPYYGAEAVA